MAKLNGVYMTDEQCEKNLITQQNLRAVNQGIRVHVQLWLDGLVTDKEITAHFAKLDTRFSRAIVRGLIDPNTGLRYE